MPVDVIHDGTSFHEPAENCCVCRKPTRFWYGTGDANVALCQNCALHVTAKELPSKKDWSNKERAIMDKEKRGFNYRAIHHKIAT